MTEFESYIRRNSELAAAYEQGRVEARGQIAALLDAHRYCHTNAHGSGYCDAILAACATPPTVADLARIALGGGGETIDPAYRGTREG